MKLSFRARDWHNWVSVLLLLPMLLVGLTAVFLAHKKELGLNDIDLGSFVRWLPGYGEAAAKQARAEVRAVLTTDGGRWLGTKAGLFRIADGRAEAVPELAGLEVRSLAAAPWGLAVATKNGIWVQRAGAWRKAHKGDAWHASLHPDGSVAVATNKGLLVSRDGEKWTQDASLAEALADIPAAEAKDERISLGRLMIDLHTGKAFLGKEAEWVWVDLLGGIWVFLGFTGLYLWWRTQTKRRDAALKRLGAGEAARG